VCCLPPSDPRLLNHLHRQGRVCYRISIENWVKESWGTKPDRKDDQFVLTSDWDDDKAWTDMHHLVSARVRNEDSMVCNWFHDRTTFAPSNFVIHHSFLSTTYMGGWSHSWLFTIQAPLQGSIQYPQISPDIPEGTHHNFALDI
jgi:hypothetical protein